MDTTKSVLIAQKAVESSEIIGGTLSWFLGKGRKTVMPTTGLIAQDTTGFFVQVQHKSGCFFKQLDASHFWGTLTKKSGEKIVYVNGKVSAIYQPTDAPVKKAVKVPSKKAVKAPSKKEVKVPSKSPELDFNAQAIAIFKSISKDGKIDTNENPIHSLYIHAVRTRDPQALKLVKALAV